MDRRGRFVGVLVGGIAAVLVPAACQKREPGRDSESEGRAILLAVRARPASPLLAGVAESFRPVTGGLSPQFGSALGRASARVVLPARSTAPLHVEDAESGAGVDVSLEDARDAAAQAADGYVVYPHAHASGATLLHRALPSGAEDFVSFETRPPGAEIAYAVTLGVGVSGLRLVADTLEMLDAGGAPRLRVAPPYLVGAEGARTDATLAVEGCAVDTSPAAPWGRPVTAPGARTCTLRVRWRDDGVAYPAVLDPRWTTTGAMVSARQDHTATRLSTNKVLVAGGRASGTSTTGLATAELFDPATATWAATGSMTGGRWSASATQLNASSNTTTGGKVLVAGGINGTASVNTAQLYSASAGTWLAAANLNAVRHLHTATLMPNGNVLVAGGMNGTAVLNTAAIYNPTTGTGTWTAVATTMASLRRSHTASLLTSSNTNFNNKVLIVGGNSGGTTSLTSVQLFDTTALTWSTTTALATAREGQTATTLANNNVLVAGGKSGTGTLATALVFTIPASGTAATWAATGSMMAARSLHTATLFPSGILTNGQVLVAGGSSGTAPIGSAELWNGTTWTLTTALPAVVQGHTATLLSSGAVLIAGGSNNGTAAVAAGAVYDPSFALGCTTNSQCTTGFCVSGVCCNTACTNQCSACNLTGLVGTCSPKANGTTCNDANACTTGETCQAGACSGGSAVTCTGADQCHTVGACVPATGCPAPVVVANNTPCNDSNACTTGEKCQAGACTGGSTVSCTGADQCHTVGACVPATGCPAPVVVANNTPCNDSNACTTGEKCQAGACTGGSTVSCTGADQCHTVGACVPATGCPAPVVVANNTPCNDANACTTGEKCQAGACTGGSTVSCTGADQCHTVGACVPATGCPAPVVVANNTPCNDANACTTGEKCQAGACTGGSTVSCTGADQCHTVGACVPATGCPAPVVVANNTPCNDANACTTGEKCQAGACTGGTTVTCTADQCHTAGTCVPATGCPTSANKPNGTACDDGNACTQFDVCQAGVCQGPTAFTCSAPNACRDAGSCNPVLAPPQPPSPQDLIGWWKLEGDGKDSSGGGHDLAIEGNVVPAPGRVGLGMKFDGTGCLSAPIWDEARMQGATGLTMMAWVDTGDDYVCPTDGVVMGRGLEYSTATQCYTADAPYGPDFTGNVRAVGDSGWGYPGGFGLVPPDAWTLVAMTWDGHTVGLYLNGTFAGSYPHEGVIRDGDPTFNIGCMNTFDVFSTPREERFMRGTIDEAMLYRRPLSNAEIAAYYAAADPCVHPAKPDGTTCDDANTCTQVDSCQAGTCVGADPATCTQCSLSSQSWLTSAGLAARWAFDDYHPSPLTDSSGNGNGATAATGNERYDLYRKPPLPGNTASLDLSVNDAWLMVPSSPSLKIAGSFTVSSWVRLASVGGTQTILSAEDASTAFSNYNLHIMDNRPYLSLAFSGSQGVGGTQAATLAGQSGGQGGCDNGGCYIWSNATFVDATHPLGTWRLVTGVYDDTTKTLSVYLDCDGAAAATFTTTGIPYTSDSGARIGRRAFNPTGGLHGSVDEVAIWHRAFARAEIQQHTECVSLTCDPSAGACKTTPAAEGSSCNDSNDCTQGDHCQSGTCTSGPAVADGTACNDGSLCTRTDLCQTGVCVGGNPVVCSALDQCHALGTCAPATGACSSPAKPSGTTCDDGNACTQGESCVAGSCQATSTFPVIVNLPVDTITVPGGNNPAANDVNSRGEIVGWSRTATGLRHTFMKDLTGAVVDVGGQAGFTADNWAVGINDAGIVTGSLTQPDGSSHAYRYSIASGLEDLGSAGDQSNDGYGDIGTYPTDINNSGEVTGYLTQSGTYRGFGYTDQVGFQEIGTLGGANSEGISINEAGTVFGASEVPGATTGYVSDWHAVSFDGTVGLMDLNSRVDPGLEWTLNFAAETGGDVVLGLGDHQGALRPYRLHLSSGVIDEINGGFEGMTVPSWANHFGDVVGVGYVDAANTMPVGFVFTDQIGFKKLNDLIDPASGWDLRPMSINDAGDIVGWGYKDGQASAFHLNLSPQSLACGTTQNSCGPSGGEICLWADGVVDVGGGHYVAVFGFQNSATTSVHPTVNQVLVNGTLAANPQPAPPAWLPPGSHTGGYLPKLDAGQTITWNVDGKTVSASAPAAGSGTGAGSTRVLTKVPIGASGYGVMIGGKLVTIQPDLTPWQTPPATEPTVQNEPAHGADLKPTLTGQLSVAPSGAATYTVPIKLPPGIAGMAPNLSLVYNSQGADGLAGQGWELGGMSVVHRCAATKAQDGHGHQVTLDDAHDFEQAVCLDGKRLFEDPLQAGTYKLEQDDHSTITKVKDDPTDPKSYANVSFKVVTKTGETRYYGRTAATRVTVHPPNLPSADVAWAVERVMDVWGNYFDIHYNGNYENDGVHPLSIDYTCHIQTDGAGCDATHGFEHVTFDYQLRPDVRPTRFGAATLSGRFRLKGITSSAGTYSLSYLHDYQQSLPFGPTNDPMMPSQLAQIDYCTGANCSCPGPACAMPLGFGWMQSSYRWEPSSGYALPDGAAIERFGNNRELTHGTQFVDLDGDGRPEFVQALAGVPFRTWNNDGNGWVQAPAYWNLPASLAQGDGSRSSTVLADVDGDGLPDLVSTGPECITNTVLGHDETTCNNTQPQVWLNRLKRANDPKWDGPQSGFFLIPSPWNIDDRPNFNAHDFMMDMNGDGKADLVRLADPTMRVWYSTGAGWTFPGDIHNLTPLFMQDALAIPANMRVADINRDGLPDLITGFGQFCNGQRTIGINTGATTGNGTVWDVKVLDDVCPSDLPKENHIVGDLDGDGFRDDMTYYKAESNPGTQVAACTGFNCGCSNIPGCVVLDDPCSSGFAVQCSCSCDSARVTRDPTVVLATGSSWTTNGNGKVLFGLDQFRPHKGEATFPSAARNDFIFAMADLNADGLADAILNHSDGGQVLVNTGLDFSDLDGQTAWHSLTGSPFERRVPVVPTDDKDFPSMGATFIDLDGDGVTDLVQKRGNLPGQAWLNKFQPPVIRTFPNGLANDSVVSYAVISTAEAQTSQNGQPPTYSDPRDATASSAFFMTPLRVVSSVSAEDGTATGTLFSTTYRYESLRASTNGRGPQGFAKVTTVDERPAKEEDPLLHRITETSYRQDYPYTGMPLLVVQSVGRTEATFPPVLPVTLSMTVNVYCDTIVEDASGNPQCQSGATYPPGTSLFVYPMATIDTTTQYDGDVNNGQVLSHTTVITEFRYDADGNPIKTTVTARMEDSDCGLRGDCPQHQKRIVNHYEGSGALGSVSTAELSRLGKVTSTTTTSQSLTPLGAPATHTTAFEYTNAQTTSPPNDAQVRAIALQRKIVEPGAGVGVEEVTAYAYDTFGNVENTLECDSDFDNCRVDACGPLGTPCGPQGSPFRFTNVRYNPAFFAPPPGGRVASLSYGDGRFPVMTTNAVGHVEYTAYDPVHGVVVQKTGPNGIHTCYDYDNFGRQRVVTERCGTGAQLVTSTMDYLATTGDPTGAKVLTLTHDPVGVGTWSYSDSLGRSIVSRGRSFDGGFTEASKAYDRWGRVASESAPRIVGSGDPLFQTVTTYDQIGRVTKVTRDLGSTDGSNASRTSIQTMTYHGVMVHTEHNLDGTDDAHLHEQPREETKGILGKVVSVKTISDDPAIGSEITYGYDGDGNLTDTFDGPNHVYIVYDTRGRKIISSDPDLGQWGYEYSGYGDLTAQTDAKRQRIEMTYDKLGRIKTRTELAGTPGASSAEWVYDVAPGAGKGKLAAVVSPIDDRLLAPCTPPYDLPGDGNRAVRSFVYTEFGDVHEETACTDGDTFVTTHEYDPFGRQSQITYPNAGGSRLSLVYGYTQLGYLYFVADAATGKLYWEGTARDARGQVTKEQTGNGVETISTRAPATGWTLASRSVAHTDSDNLIQNWNYGFDEIGNLRTRSRADNVSGAASNEIFTYDALNRLRTAETNIPSQEYHNVDGSAYDFRGNITHKGNNDYTYGDCGAGPHAVCTVGGGSPFVYDPNGNMTNGAGRAVTYNPANKPKLIENDTRAVEFIYGPDSHRIVQITHPIGGSEDSRTVYVGLGATGKSLYERTTRGGTFEHTHFLFAGDAHGGAAFAIKVSKGQPASAPTTSYYHFDHLGSVTAMSDEVGHVVTPDWGGGAATILGYDAWGARRDPTGRTADPASFALQPGHREFTGHEAIPDVGLVNMNGRVYDPVVGRFLSPDPNVQFVADLQSYNRYSYVLNNPLRYTDPTGYFSIGSFAASVGIGLLCAATDGGACLAASIMLTQYQVTSMLAAGAPLDQVVLATGVGIGSGLVGGFVGQGVGQGVAAASEGRIAGAMLGGAVGSVVSNVLGTVALGGSLGVGNLLSSAAQGAIFAGLSAAIHGTNPVSLASEQGGGGSGADYAEKLETLLAANTSGMSSDDMGAEIRLTHDFGPSTGDSTVATETEGTSGNDGAGGGAGGNYGRGQLALDVFSAVAEKAGARGGNKMMEAIGKVGGKLSKRATIVESAWNLASSMDPKLTPEEGWDRMAKGTSGLFGLYGEVAGPILGIPASMAIEKAVDQGFKAGWWLTEGVAKGLSDPMLIQVSGQ